MKFIVTRDPNPLTRWQWRFWYDERSHALILDSYATFDQMILILKMDDGTTKACDTNAPTWAFIRDIQNNPIETIVVGDVKGTKVLWEKHFNAADVVPSDFGKKKG